MFGLVLLCFASCRRHLSSEERELLETSREIDQMEADDNAAFQEFAEEMREELESNRAISGKKVQKFIDFLEARKQKKRIRKLFDKLLKKRGLDKVTGKKIATIQKGCKLAKTKCVKAQKLARRRTRK